MSNPIFVVPHDPRWREAFEREAPLVASALGDVVIGIHHIGSTAIPGIYAKPIVDILVEVREIETVDHRSPRMVGLGYEPKGEYGVPGRRYFRRDSPEGVRLHHVHVFETGNPALTQHLDFRDYLREHPERATEYSDLKRALAPACRDDSAVYMNGKDAFIKEVLAEAAAWRRRTSPPPASIPDRRPAAGDPDTASRP